MLVFDFQQNSVADNELYSKIDKRINGTARAAEPSSFNGNIILPSLV